jgi:hypothetical protein
MFPLPVAVELQLGTVRGADEADRHRQIVLPERASRNGGGDQEEAKLPTVLSDTLLSLA